MPRLVWKYTIVALLAVSGRTAQDPSYDLLLKGGHVIDPKNEISAVRDVAITDGKIAAVAENLPEGRARRVVDASGLYVTPGLVDIHVNVFAADMSPVVTKKLDRQTQR